MRTITLEKGLATFINALLRQEQKRGNHQSLSNGYPAIYLVSPCK